MDLKKKPSIKTITVKGITNLLLILSLILLAVTGINFRALSRQAIENQALAHAELVKSGLTAHMKAGIMDRRSYYLEEIKQMHNIKHLQIIRGEPVLEQFGPGEPLEKEIDAVTVQAFDSKRPIFHLNEFSAHPSVRAIIPYIAARDGPLNCTECHAVAAGTVLGAVDIEIDVTDHRNHALLVLSGIFAMSVTFIILILINTSRTIQRHVKQPLETLIEKAKFAYKQHKPVSQDAFKTREFASVAHEINLFNSEIIANQDLLRKKNEELLALNDEIESTLRETVYTMGVIEEQRSKETNNHTRRVTMYSRLLAEKIGLVAGEVTLLADAAPLHDIGKLGVPDEILFKPDVLTPEERRIMENHTYIGHAMLMHSKRDILKVAGIIALQHHEHWDGSGYPQGLEGEQIHIYGRIVALADVFDALISARVYKEPWGLRETIAWISGQRGRHFDPLLVDVFLNNVAEFEKIQRRFPAEATAPLWNVASLNR